MKATLTLLAVLAVGYTVLSTTVIIWAELDATKTEISILQKNLLDAEITIRIQEKEIAHQSILLNWNKDNCK